MGGGREFETGIWMLRGLEARIWVKGEHLRWMSNRRKRARGGRVNGLNVKDSYM